MNILFIVTSFWSYGELVIACEFAKRISKNEYKPYFLIPPTHEKIIRSYQFSFTTLLPRNGNINRIILKDIENRLKPRVVLLADFLNYNFCEEHYGLKTEDLNIFLGKLGTFDNFNWSITGEHMDTYGFRAKGFAEIDVRKYGFSLCPCPITSPLESGESEDTFYYELISEKLPYDIDNTKKWKLELGIPLEQKLILFTHATWQETYKQYPDVKAFVEANNEAFDYIIKELAKKHYIICVGAKSRYSNAESANIHFLEQLSPTDFEKYLLATDLFISRNITSTSLARAVVSGVPSVNFSNSIFFSEKRTIDLNELKFKPIDKIQKLLETLRRCYPYRMFPVGWYKFLNPILKENSYYNIVVNLEQFDVIGSLEKINNMLLCDTSKKNFSNKVEIYRKRLSGLPGASEILDKVIK